LLILPKSGMMRNGKLWAQTMWVLGTEENGFGLWPTPQAMDAVLLDCPPRKAAKGLHARRLSEIVKDKSMFPTPRAREGNAGKPGSKGSTHNAKRGYLDGVIQEMFPTPAARDWKDTGENVNWEKVAKKSKLAGRVMLPTPTAAEADKIPAKANYGQIGLNNHPLLRGYPTRPKATKSRKGEKMVFPTPTAIADTNNAAPKHDHEKRILRGVVHDKNLSAHEANLIGQLNPTWVEWLMGYPSGWTDLKVSETQLCRTSPISSESDLKNYAKKTKPKNISPKP